MYGIFASLNVLLYGLANSTSIFLAEKWDID